MDNSNSTKQCIHNALIELMMEVDVEKITAKQLAEKAHVSRATLYRYYSSVDEVLKEIESDFLERMRDESRYYISFELNFEKNGKASPAIVAVAEFFKANQKAYLSLTGQHGDQSFSYRLHKFIREFYTGKLAYEGFNRKDVDLYVEFVLAGSDGIIRYWLEKRSDVTPVEIAPIIQEILYKPFINK